MARYSIKVLGKSPDGMDYKFCVGANISDDKVVRTYVYDLLIKRLERTFTGDWWVDSIVNEDVGKRLLL